MTIFFNVIKNFYSGSGYANVLSRLMIMLMIMITAATTKIFPAGMMTILISIMTFLYRLIIILRLNGKTVQRISSTGCPGIPMTGSALVVAHRPCKAFTTRRKIFVFGTLETTKDR